MSLATGDRRRAQPARRDARARPPAHPRPADPAQPRARDAAHRPRRDLPRAHARHHVADRRRPRRACAGALAKLCDDAHDAVAAGVNVLILSDRQVGPERARDPVAAGRRRRAPAPRARGHAPADRPRARVRRAARGPPLGDADRLRLQRDQPVPAARHGRRAGRRGPRRRASTTPTTAERNIVKAIGKGLLKTISKMGISTIAVLLRRADLRGRRPREGRSSTATSPAPRRGSAASASTCSRARRSTATPPPTRADHERAAARRRHLRLAPRRRAPHVEPRDDRAAAARRALTAERRRAGEVRRVRARSSTTTPSRRATLRGLMKFRTDGVEPIAARRGRAGQGDRQALRHRRDVAGLDLDASRTRRSRSR